MSLRARGQNRSGAFSGHKAGQAVIDIGSNTVRLVIFGGAPRAPTVLFNEKVVARLGHDIAETGLLAEDAMEMALSGLARYALLLRDLGIRDVNVVATAAVRNSRNGIAFLDQVSALGLSPRLLSGEEEARISAMGVVGAFPGLDAVVADLGGGSIEFTRITDGTCEAGASLPLGTLRLHEMRQGKNGARSVSDMSRTIQTMLEEAGWADPVMAPICLVGGAWRAMAVYAMTQRDWPLSDPHGYEMSRKDAVALAKDLSSKDAQELRKIPRISSMRAGQLADTAILLQAMLECQQPDRLIISAWGLREGLLFDRLDPVEKRQDPLLSAMSLFATQRGASPSFVTRVAGWTVGALPPNGTGTERLRLAATMLALASMQVEPNLRLHQAAEWAMQKRWVGLEPDERAMIAMTVRANGNDLSIPEEFERIASREQLDEAMSWGLAIRLCRRLGGQSRRSLEVSRLQVEDARLVLELEESHAALYGVPTRKDMRLLSRALGLEPELRIIMDGEAESECVSAIKA